MNSVLLEVTYIAQKDGHMGLQTHCCMKVWSKLFYVHISNFMFRKWTGGGDIRGVILFQWTLLLRYSSKLT